jgi:hypothetical protein
MELARENSNQNTKIINKKKISRCIVKRKVSHKKADMSILFRYSEYRLKCYDNHSIQVDRKNSHRVVTSF